MNNILPTALVILGVLWLVRDLYALESNRGLRHGQSDFFFDDKSPPLQNSTPSAENIADALSLQKILQSTIPEEAKPEDGSEESEDDKKPQDKSSFMSSIGSLADVWKLLHHVASLLNPLSGNSVNPLSKENQTSASPKMNLTSTTLGDIDLDEPFETTIEYASGNDSYDDEDYEESMNFSSPNPQSILTSPIIHGSSFVTPKFANPDASVSYSSNKSVTKNPVVKNSTPNLDVSQSIDSEEEIPTSEFIDDYINKPPKKSPETKTNTTSPVNKSDKTTPKTLNKKPPTRNDPDRNDGTSNSTKTSFPPKSKNSTNATQKQNGTDIPSKNYTTTQSPIPDENSEEINVKRTVSPTKNKSLGNIPISTKKPKLTGQSVEPNDEIGALKTTPSQKFSGSPIRKPIVKPNIKKITEAPIKKPQTQSNLEKTTRAPVQTPLKRPNLKASPSAKSYQTTKMPTDTRKIKEKEVLNNISTDLPPQASASTSYPKSVKRVMPRKRKFPQLASSVLLDKPSLLVTPLNKPPTANTEPTNAQQFDKMQTPKPQNQPSTTSKPSKKQPNFTKKQPNVRKEPSKKQLNNTLITPQNQSNANSDNSNNTSLLTPLDIIGYAEFLNRFPRIKALLPNIPLLHETLNIESSAENQTNGTDSPFLKKCNTTVTPENGLSEAGMATTPIEKPENVTSPPSTEPPINITKAPAEYTTSQQINITKAPPKDTTSQPDSDNSGNDSTSRQDNSPDEYPGSTEVDNTDDTDHDADDTDNNADDTDNDTEDAYHDSEDVDHTSDDTDHDTNDADQEPNDSADESADENPDENAEENADDNTDDNAYDNTDDNPDDNKPEDSREEKEEPVDSSVFDNFKDIFSNTMPQFSQSASFANTHDIISNAMAQFIKTQEIINKAIAAHKAQFPQSASSVSTKEVTSSTVAPTPQKTSPSVSTKEITSSTVAPQPQKTPPSVSTKETSSTAAHLTQESSSASTTGLISSTMAQLLEDASSFEPKNCTDAPTSHENPAHENPAEGYDSILEYIYDHSRNPLFANIRRQQNKTRS